ncbi:hypothetical protein J7E68_14025 [Microbacterium sp. ISL-103]|uniref:hypothetical protein n=1 Tax=Microbacterium sp. ISL-103 TaxID=2819156 RepID=UPI001BEAAD50|nr:hypothetical protein [Microbacterium sp. ISL-103]MBT2475659.1 hypothetical protein [Microbacterium sp. ISL-103]
MRVLVDSVKRGQATVAAWTLTRATIESLGRVNLLLNADTELDVLSRHVSLIRGELKFARHSVHIIRDVGALDVGEYLANLRTMIRQIGGAIVAPPSYTGWRPRFSRKRHPATGHGPGTRSCPALRTAS